MIRAAWGWVKANRIMVAQMFCFFMGKLFFAIVELPHYEKDGNYLVILMISAVFYICSLIAKLYSMRGTTFKEILFLNLKLFLIWVASFLLMIFNFSLCHALGWYFAQNVTNQTCIFLQCAILVLMCQSRFITKSQFIVYELFLAINIISLAIKTVLFIEFESKRDYKDIVLINLTTQIALSILIMDTIERAYSAKVEGEKQQQEGQIHRELNETK